MAKFSERMEESDSKSKKEGIAVFRDIYDLGRNNVNSPSIQQIFRNKHML